MDKANESIKDWWKLLKDNNIDYYKLKEYLNSDLWIKEVGEVIDDENNNYTIKKSLIHGKGVFANYNIDKGRIIGLGYFNNSRTMLGRYTNHSHLNNAKFYYKEDAIVLMAESNIAKDEEILVDYRHHLLNKSFI
jgi:hypothetical protein